MVNCLVLVLEVCRIDVDRLYSLLDIASSSQMEWCQGRFFEMKKLKDFKQYWREQSRHSS